MLMGTNLRRSCAANNERGEACRQAPLADKGFCFWHDPAFEAQAAQARRSGGVARAREIALKHVYGIDHLRTLEQISRAVEVGTFELLALDNGVARDRAIISGALAAAKILEVGDLEGRIEAMEAVLGPKLPQKRQDKKRGWLR